MARIPRCLKVLPGFAVHKIWRGHNKEWNLATDSEKGQYAAFLNDELESEKNTNELNVATFMSSHAHEMYQIHSQPLFSDQMRRHHARYGQLFNKHHQRSGKVAEDRPKTCLIANDYYSMRATFYIHANPVRANMVRDAKDYYWSTHRLYAYGKREKWMKNVIFPRWYMRLGKTMEDRQRKYRKLFDRYLREENLIKRYFLYKPFFGPYRWEEKLQRRIKQWRQDHAPP